MDETDLDKLPNRVKYYLLAWKDENMSEYLRLHGDLRLHDLDLDQLHLLFSYITTKDCALLARISS